MPGTSAHRFTGMMVRPFSRPMPTFHQMRSPLAKQHLFADLISSYSKLTGWSAGLHLFLGRQRNETRGTTQA
jgi:hypothetical protein